MTDPIADLLTRIRNAQAVGKETVHSPFSKIRWSLLGILVREGFLVAVEKKGRGTKRNILITLKPQEEKRPFIEGLRRMSKPGRRIFVGVGEIPRVKQGYGIAVLSTTEGLLTDTEARRKKIGGELLCEIW